MSSDQIGAIIESGPMDWQIVQQYGNGYGKIELNGRWVGEAPGQVEVRLVNEVTAVPVSPDLDWHGAETYPDGTWSTLLDQIPAGGLYRLETRYRASIVIVGEGAARGDMRHFIGVGDLWVIAGQSNSAGYGRGPVFDPPELGVHLFRNNDTWMLACHPFNESTETCHPVNREFYNPGHSPYLNFGRVLKQRLNYPIGLVQASLGGSPLSAWNPTESSPAVLYENMLQIIQLVGGKVKGILWYQGESDAGEKEAPTYAERFINCIEAWRKVLDAPELPVITVQIHRYYQPEPNPNNKGWSLIREAQRQVPKKLKGVAVVSTLDLPLSDPVHTSPAGNMSLGERMAQAALGMVYHQSVDYLAPDVDSAVRTDNGDAIDLHFQNVTSRMDNINLQSDCFSVEDEKGENPVEHTSYTGKAVIRLVLSRQLSGQAVVSGCSGINPPIAPVDMERRMPMLGFYRLPVM